MREYDLYVIEDAEVPMAAGPAGSSHYYILTVAVILLILAGMWIAYRELRIYQLRKRLLQLRENAGITNTTTPHCIRQLEEEIANAESNLSAAML